MQQPTSRQLYAYWDRVRNGRVAPRRFEIEPAKIAALLPETFIAECAGMLGYRFRLAGTKICEQFGRELGGADLLSLWDTDDRDAVASLLRNVLTDAVVGAFRLLRLLENQPAGEFRARSVAADPHRRGHQSRSRRITAIEPPFWLGAEPLSRQEIVEMHLHWPDGTPSPAARSGADVVRLARRRFRVFEGGLTGGGE
jgi:hypothetical protein